jgi:hypothetical protein
MNIYQGPLANTLKILKRVSVLTLGVSVSSTASLAFVDYQSTTLILTSLGMGTLNFKLKIAFLTSALSTGLIHYCTSPYVCSVSKLSPEEIKLTTLSFFGNPIESTVNISHIYNDNKGFSNWTSTQSLKTDSRWNWMPKHQRNRFYIHRELEGISDEMKDLLIRINVNALRKSTSSNVSTPWNVDQHVASIRKEMNNRIKL